MAEKKEQIDTAKIIREVRERIEGSLKKELSEQRKTFEFPRPMALVIGEVPKRTVISENNSTRREPRTLSDYMSLRGWKNE